MDRNVQFLFSDHVLDIDRRELARGGEGIAIEPQVFDLLVYLVENRDRVVTKDDLIEKIWEGRIVSESTLTSRINAARRAVGDSGKDQGLIRTIARKGFRFVGDVRCAEQPVAAASLEPPTSRIAAAGSPGYCRAAVHQHERRAGTGIFLRRHQRRHHHCIIEAALVLRDRAQFVLHLQGQVRAPEAGRR